MNQKRVLAMQEAARHHMEKAKFLWRFDSIQIPYYGDLSDFKFP